MRRGEGGEIKQEGKTSTVRMEAIGALSISKFENERPAKFHLGFMYGVSGDKMVLNMSHAM